MSDLEEENAPAKPCGPTTAATCALVATEEEGRKSPLPESEPDKLPTGTPSGETCLSASPDTGHEWTAGGRTSTS